jgi:hypothetical protein
MESELRKEPEQDDEQVEAVAQMAQCGRVSPEKPKNKSYRVVSFDSGPRTAITTENPQRPVARLARSNSPTPSRRIVSVSSMPSARLRALGFTRSKCRMIFPSSALASAI